MTNAFKLAGEQINEIAVASDGTVQVHDEEQRSEVFYRFEISIRFDGLERTTDGLRIRAREIFHVLIPHTFPFDPPVVVTPHIRFSGFHHVQWRRFLCLYRSSADWRPENGMYGLVKQLDSWIRAAAINNLDPHDAPLHPPVAYSNVKRLFIPKADTPLVTDTPWFGFAVLRERHNRTEIVDWKEHVEDCLGECAPAILLHEDFPFEYPETVNALLNELESHGIDCVRYIHQLASYARHTESGTPLVVVLGTPMRRIDEGGRALQHLAVWEITAKDVDKLRELSVSLQLGDADSWSAAVDNVVNWAVSAKVGWCMVREMRPEVTRRRDMSSPMSWFNGKHIAIWGCGAIGTHAAVSVVRAGAKTVEIADNKTVTPGLLVRQDFEDADIGRYKADALADRLKRINPDLEVVSSTNDLIERISNSDIPWKVDLVIDCTASLAVRTVLEHSLRYAHSKPAIASIAIDSQAASAMATLAMPDHSGCTLDLIRQLKLEACRSTRLSEPLKAFWSRNVSNEEFQPEPGCSEPTFIGSNADLAGLSAQMLNSIARAISRPKESQTGMGWLSNKSGPIFAFSWPPDLTLRDNERGYSVRVRSQAVREMRSWAKRTIRTVGPNIETGGLVFGELNEAASVLWVTDVEGPPPDSHAAEDHFTCGTEGMQDIALKKQSMYYGSVDCIGSWHTHPTSAPYPSKVDLGAVAQLLTESDSTRRTCLILILSGDPDDPDLGAHAFRTEMSSEYLFSIDWNTATKVHVGNQLDRPQNVGLALSGGGSRAIAFHLGCLRALHDLDLLSRVQVISSVSGGSVIAAMYAYFNEPFQEFETRVVQLLGRGLHRDVLFELLRPSSLWKVVKAQVVASVFFFFRVLHRLIWIAIHVFRPTVHARRYPPAPRAFSRTEAFKDVIAKSLFGDKTVRDVSRDSLHTVINATELRTGSAFRFGSQESGCWRFGTIAPQEALVADAVAASAAYPVLLPALERKYRFSKHGSTTEPTRVLLTDGGVFENLGVSPMEPGRSSTFSTNVFNPDYIICCDAGAGLFDDDNYPTLWHTRMCRSFLTVFRKVQDATRKQLHYFDDSGKILGFVLCYLGQQDTRLPWIPPGLPIRDEVRNYPTDFRAMSTEDIDRLALRGELLMRFLVAHYLPDL